MSKEKQIRLTPAESTIWKLLKIGGHFMRKHIDFDSKECYRLLTDDMKPIRNVTINQFAKLKILNRIVHRENKWVFNPDWHGNKRINKSHKSI